MLIMPVLLCCTLTFAAHLQAVACAAFHWRKHDLFKQLVEAGQMRNSSDKALLSSADTASFSAVLGILSAVHNLQQSTTGTSESVPSDTALTEYADQLSRHAEAASEVLPDVAIDAVYLLWQSARPLLEGAVGVKDVGAEAALKVCHVQAITNTHMYVRHNRAGASAVIVLGGVSPTQ